MRPQVFSGFLGLSHGLVASFQDGVSKKMSLNVQGLHLHHACCCPISQSLSHGQVQSQSGKELHKIIKARNHSSLGTTKLPGGHRVGIKPSLPKRLLIMG